MSPSSSPKGHVIAMCLPFGGHVYPLFNLVQKLAYSAPDVRFSFINAPESNATHFSGGVDALASLPNVRMYEAGDGKSLEHFLSAKSSYQSTIRVAERESGQNVSCLLTDALMLFACDIAEAMNVKWIALWVPAPYNLSSFMYGEVIADLCRENADKPNGEIRLTAFPGLSMMFLEDLPNKQLLEDYDSVMSATFRSLPHVLPRATVLLQNSYVEANPRELVDDLKSMFKRLLYVGCLTVSFEPALAESKVEDKTGCLSWLDKQKPKTVVYISFGSLVNISPEEIHAVAEALEEMSMPFLWSLKDHLRAHFPEGFQERTEHQGKLVPWAPQGLVLGHSACLVYVTHCGYNSVFESVAGGVPMICRPIWADNMMNGRMVEEVWGIGVKVDQANGAITKEGMVKRLRTVLDSEEGRAMRWRIAEFREKLAAAAGEGGSAGRDFRSLLEIIISP